MNGWRARLGVIVPSSNTTVEPEFQRVCPTGVSVHTARIPLEDVTADSLDAMADRVVECAELLSHADVVPSIRIRPGISYTALTSMQSWKNRPKRQQIVPKAFR